MPSIDLNEDHGFTRDGRNSALPAPSSRIRHIQRTALVLVLVSGVINYVDRASLAVGVDAAVVAARKSDALRAVGDADGSDVWQRILEGIAEFWRTTPAKGERLH